MRCTLMLFDMDGTLLNSEKQIPEETIDMIAKAQRRGLTCALGTGRCFTELAPYMDQLKEIRYGVLESGGVVYDMKEKKILHQNCFSDPVIDKILEVTAGRDIMLQFMSDSEAYTTGSNVPKMDHFQVGQYRELYEMCVNEVDEVRDELELRRSKVEKINLFHTSPEEREKTKELLKNVPLEMAEAEISSLELQPLGVHKGRGLLDLCGTLKKDLAETAAIGDSDNDITMLGAAEYAFAMGNANEAAKKAADFIVADNDHGGIIEAIEKALTFR